MNLQDEAALHTIRVISTSDGKKVENIGGVVYYIFEIYYLYYQ